MTTEASPILNFLIELRKRIFYCLMIVGIIFCVLFSFSNTLYTLLAKPLLKFLPEGHGLIATTITAPFFVPFELAFVVSLCVAMPFVLMQLWAFIAPALYQHEKRFLWPMIGLSTLLFYCGMAFAYWIALPLIFKFLTHAAPQGVWVSPDISQYLDFTLKFFLIFGVIFEIPIISLVLIRTKIISQKKLIYFRPYAVIGAFVIGMLTAPPDIFSQTLVALPIWILYESGILLARIFK